MTDHESTERFQPAAMLLAAALPGAGHVFLGHARRGFCVAAGVLGLFFGGLFLGGIDSVDAQEDRIWFAGQMLVGPLAFGVNAAHQNFFKGYDPQTGRLRSPNPGEHIVMEARANAGRTGPGAAAGAGSGDLLPIVRPGGTPPARKSLARANELGTLMSAVAGMMNLIAVIDASFAARRRRSGAPA